MKTIWITDAEYKNEFQLFLKFNDNTQGVVDLKDKLKGPMFEPLRNKDVFKNFRLNAWTIEWPNGADFAPEFLYGRVLENQIMVETG